MDPSTTRRALDLADRLLAARHDQRRAEHRLAHLLAEMADASLHHALGYASVAEYAEAVLDLDRRQARELLRLGRRLPDFPAIDAALGAGDLDWTKAREVLRVATPDTEIAWLERAKATTSRALEREVAGALVGEPPPAGESAEPRAPARRRVVIEMESVDAEALFQALAVARSQLGSSRDEVEDGVLLAGIARRFLHDAEPEHAATGEPYRVVIEHCPDCGATSGVDAEVSDTVASEAACDAEIIDMRTGASRGHVSRAIPPATRRAVFHRDGWRCVVPHCRNRTWLHLHHIDGRARGHGERRLATVCGGHHRAIHDGVLALERGPDGSIVVTHADGRRFSTHVGHTDAIPAMAAPDRPGDTGGEDAPPA